MKTKYPFSAIIVVLFLAISNGAFSHPIHGKVFNVLKNAPQANHEVFFITPLSADTLLTTTDNNGAFSADIQIENADSFYINVCTIDPCSGIMLQKFFFPFTSTDYAEFKICTDSVYEPLCQAHFEYYAEYSGSDSSVNSNGEIANTEYKFYFYDKSFGNITKWEWNFGDGNISYDQNPVHSYFSPGEYFVSLTVSGPECSSFVQYPVKVGYYEPTCYAWFYYDFGTNSDSTTNWKDSVDNDMLTVYFHDYSTGNPTYWKWDFGDGFTSVERNPVHTYQKPGEYYVYLYITGENCENWYSMPVWVGNYEPPCQAMFGYDYYNWYDSTAYYRDTLKDDFSTIYFYDYSYGKPTAWKWDFGDGNYSNEQNPTHKYEKEGEYIVSLSINNENDCSSTYTSYVYTWNYYNDTVWENWGCQALFYPMVENSNKVTFYNQSYGNIDNYYWEFGDGYSSDEVNPIHQYSSEGEYLVTLSINNSYDSCYSKFEMVVYVYDYDYDYSTDSILNALFIPEISGNTVTFIDKSEGTIYNRYWDFGDGTSSTSKDPIHIYPELKTYYVTLGVSNDFAVRTFSMEINLSDGTYKGYFGSEDATGIKKENSFSSLNLYPNPVNDKLTVSFENKKNGIGKMVLTNITGQVIIEKEITYTDGTNTFEFATDFLEKGVYFINIQSGNTNSMSKKIVK